MKIASWNVNGIRAVERKGALKEFLDTHDPDILFLQETKAKEAQIHHIKDTFDEYEQFYHSAQKPGYAGTAAWVKKDTIKDSEYLDIFPGYDDNEGRISRIDTDNMSLLGVYFPNGGKSPQAWQEKLLFYDTFLEYVNQLRAKGRDVIWCGDVNCAHNEIDLARPETNRKSIGFLPEERDWVTRCISQGWIDVWRKKYPTEIIYSWWHVISRARERNVGWRIDYFFADETLLPNIKNIAYLNDQMGSDHCPVILEIQ